MVFPGTVYLHKYTVPFLCRFGKRRKKAPSDEGAGCTKCRLGERHNYPSVSLFG